MPWRSSCSSFYRSSNPFQCKGETMSLKNALKQYGITQEQVDNADPPVPCQWRSCHGNTYAVVTCSDMIELKTRLKRQAEEQKEKALIEKHGVEGLAKLRREEKEHKEAEKTIDVILLKLRNLMSVSDGEIVATSSLEGLQLPKTRAKSEWYLKDSDLESLNPEKVGRTFKYKAFDLIAKSLDKHGHVVLLEKISAFSDRRQLYARYIKNQLDAELSNLPQDLIKEACEKAKASFQKDADESQAKVQEAEVQLSAARQDLEKKQNRCRSFHLISTELSSATGKEDNDVPTASPTKKQKIITP